MVHSHTAVSATDGKDYPLSSSGLGISFHLSPGNNGLVLEQGDGLEETSSILDANYILTVSNDAFIENVNPAKVYINICSNLVLERCPVMQRNAVVSAIIRNSSARREDDNDSMYIYYNNLK